MKVLVINCGSSTLKFMLFAAGGGSSLQRISSGAVDKIGGQSQVDFTAASGVSLKKEQPIADHKEASHAVLDWLITNNIINKEESLAVGHRVIHGGSRFTEPVLIDENVIAAIDALIELAPLHNQPSLQAIRAVRAVLGEQMPMAAVFDTAFHRTIPEHASRYALPYELADKYHIYRYGFHGLAHRSMTEHYAAITGRPLAQVKLITLQLGNGCSAAAVSCGKSVDTSMGFTPLEGLIMGTRSGNLDPSIPGYLARREDMSMEAIDALLNTKSGLLGVSGISRDMRELSAAARQGNKKADLAVEMFCYHIKKYIGAYLAALGGAEAIIFGGGIGENSADVRARICAGMEWCGLLLDPERNASAAGKELRISTDDSRLHAYVIPVDEALIIARDTVTLLTAKRKRGEL